MIITGISQGLLYYNNSGDFVNTMNYKNPTNPNKCLVQWENKNGLPYCGLELINIEPAKVNFFCYINKALVNHLLTGFEGNKNEITVQFTVFIVEFY